MPNFQPASVYPVTSTNPIPPLKMGKKMWHYHLWQPMKDKSPIMNFPSSTSSKVFFFFFNSSELNQLLKGIHSLLHQELFLNSCWGQALNWLPEGRALKGRPGGQGSLHRGRTWTKSVLILLLLFKQSMTSKSFEKSNSAQRLTTEKSILFSPTSPCSPEALSPVVYLPLSKYPSL